MNRMKLKQLRVIFYQDKNFCCSNVRYTAGNIRTPLATYVTPYEFVKNISLFWMKKSLKFNMKKFFLITGKVTFDYGLTKKFN